MDAHFSSLIKKSQVIQITAIHKYTLRLIQSSNLQNQNNLLQYPLYKFNLNFKHMDNQRRFGVLMAVSARITVFLDSTLCSLAENDQSALTETAHSYKTFKMFHQIARCYIPKKQKSSYSKSLLKYSITFNKLSSSLQSSFLCFDIFLMGTRM
jgi:hypothetical protein